MTRPSALHCHRIESGYGDTIVLRDVSLTIPSHQIFAVLGKNGMGKSTLLKTIMGFQKPRRGEIHLAGEPVTGLAPHRIARRGVAYIPQEAALFQDLTVEDNLRLAIASDRKLGSAMEKTAAYFPVIAERRRQKAGTLSGGEQKMLLMSRALACEPRLMLIDELSEGLQPTLIERIADALKALTAEEGMTVLLVEQNVRFAGKVADACALIRIGELAAELRLEGNGDHEQALAEMMAE